jgi:circadian clock protein KaiC
MKQKIQLLQSGIPLVDNAWGGFYRGGTYLLLGAHKSGKTLLGLQYAMECARQKETCLYFTSMRPKDLMIQAASIDFDLQHYMNQNQIIVVRVAPPSDLYEVNNPDDFLDEYMNDIITVVNQYQPNKIVFDELTPFVGFLDLGLLQQSFGRTCEEIEEAGITSLFLLGDPATQTAQSIVDSIASLSTGIIYLKKNEDSSGIRNTGEITITPNIGHTEGQYTANYQIEPYKGITVNFVATDTLVMNKSNESKIEQPENIPPKYKSLVDMDIPADTTFFNSYYSLNDFKLILNNQIALFNSTGQVFTILSFHLDKLAEKKDILTIAHLQNAIRLSTDKKDKICVLDNKVIVLLTKEDTRKITGLIAKIKSNLPSHNKEYVDEVLKYISVCAVKVDETVTNADDIFEQLLSEETQAKNKVEIQ